MSQSTAVPDIQSQLQQLDQDLEEEKRRIEEKAEERRKALIEPAKSRLAEISKLRDELDREEAHLLMLIGDKKSRRRRRGKRMTRAHKKEIVGRFINEGHIRDQQDLTKQLRAALTDEGFTSNDYLPSGWEARSNGMRGTAARTTFLRS